MKKYKKIILGIIIILLFFIVYVTKVLFNNNMESKKNVKTEPRIINYTNNEKEVAKLIGKWKFTKRIMYPKAYSKKAQILCDKKYLGRTIEIKEDLFQAETFEIKDPFYNIVSVNNSYELMSGEGYLRNSNITKYIKKEKYNLLELLENEPIKEGINYEDESYQDNDIWTLLVIDNETMIFFEDGCFEVKKLQ